MQPFEALDDYKALMANIVANESEAAAALSGWLLRRYHPSSVVDVGCGPGIYLLPFLDAGAVVLGLDASEHAGGCVTGRFQRADLRFPLESFGRFDLAMCLETAEHLPCEFSDVLVRSVTGLSDRIVFSAAKPGQVGLHHHCCQEQSYWTSRFGRHGFVVGADTDALIRYMGAERAFDRTPWLRENIMVLERPAQ